MPPALSEVEVALPNQFVLDFAEFIERVALVDVFELTLQIGAILARPST